MSRTAFTRTRLLARLAAPVVLASVLGACSSVPDWVDPTGWFGSDSQASSDQSASAPAEATQASTPAQTPDLASIPSKPTPPSTPDEQQQVANSLVADRSQAQYSAEALQGGTEPVAAPPPPAQSPADAPADQAGAAPTAPASSGSADTAAPADTSTTTTAADNGAAPPADTAAPAAQPAAPADSGGTQGASTESPVTTAPAAAPMAAAESSAPPATVNQATFAPSRAPALDPSVAQYVPQRILSRYQQTAAAASVPGVEGMTAAANPKPAHRRKGKAAASQPAPDSAGAPAQ
ncbi:MAG TPA: hypothetical protein VKR31_04160 [Rhizomicrobium sp.]|nr:hypothetical protein [Rhizomicrobium sp.]